MQTSAKPAPSVTRLSLSCGQGDREFFTDAGGGPRILDRADDDAPSSADYLLMALGTCTIGTLRNFMRRKELSTKDLRIEVSTTFNEAEHRYEALRIVLHFDPAFDAATRRMLGNVAKTCRIHKTLVNTTEVAIDLAPNT